MSDIASEYMEASKQNPHKFKPPRVSFVFCDGITESISREFTSLSLARVTGPAKSPVCLDNLYGHIRIHVHEHVENYIDCMHMGRKWTNSCTILTLICMKVMWSVTYSLVPRLSPLAHIHAYNNSSI